MKIDYVCFWCFMSLGYQKNLDPENCMYKFDEISKILSSTAEKLCTGNNNVYISSIFYVRFFWAMQYYFDTLISYSTDVTHTCLTFETTLNLSVIIIRCVNNSRKCLNNQCNAKRKVNGKTTLKQYSAEFPIN